MIYKLNAGHLLAFFLLITLSSCSLSKQIGKQANTFLLKDSAIQHGHIGISIYEPATGKYWFNYNADKYFIPASNTKLFSLYAGMKYLGDSLPAADLWEDGTTLHLLPSGDPTLLNSEFEYQPLLKVLKNTNKNIVVDDANWREKPLGSGWSWNDYSEYYMTERSALPVFGNVLLVSGNIFNNGVIPSFFKSNLHWDSLQNINTPVSDVKRVRNNNEFSIGSSSLRDTAVATFSTNNGLVNYAILADVIKKNIDRSGKNNRSTTPGSIVKIFSQPKDSLFKPMMHRSDNFFAEQTLLMASNQLLGYMNDEAIIDTILKSALKDIPQKPKWVDGSGLSRYNLFSPQDFVFILQKLKDEFGLDRMKNILATGGEGTIRSYYQEHAGFIYAKTGTLSNNCALSGYLITKKGKLLIFSVLANNYYSAATPVRRAVERFLSGIRSQY